MHVVETYIAIIEELKTKQVLAQHTYISAAILTIAVEMQPIWQIVDKLRNEKDNIEYVDRERFESTTRYILNTSRISLNEIKNRILSLETSINDQCKHKSEKLGSTKKMVKLRKKTTRKRN